MPTVSIGALSHSTGHHGHPRSHRIVLNPDVLLHRGIVLNHPGGSSPHTSARTYPGCSLFRRSLHASGEGEQRRRLPHVPASWCWAGCRGELAMGGSDVLGAGEVGGEQIPCMWEAGRVVARGVEERDAGTDGIGLGGGEVEASRSRARRRRGESYTMSGGKGRGDGQNRLSISIFLFFLFCMRESGGKVRCPDVLTRRTSGR
ncbi:hypothetical protein SORBI_3008G025550 [Sorghum bicolor]|uniref:Uncharacterized protein n=1 Tax=Sorghum bicolor TaxID=4558 RepID=A0A1Z5R5L6_SORBI|nr:hypothetical protein SORBI_3008G025550 [Sorghum bicolor]